MYMYRKKIKQAHSDTYTGMEKYIMASKTEKTAVTNILRVSIPICKCKKTSKQTTLAYIL